MIVFGSALWFPFCLSLLLGADVLWDPSGGEVFLGGQAQLLRSQTLLLMHLCLLFRGTHCREEQSLGVLEQTVQSRQSVVSLAAGGGFAFRSRV